MYSFWQSHRRKIAVLLLVLAPILMLSTSAGAGVGDRAAAPTRIGVAGLSWVQLGGQRIVGGVTGWFGDLVGGDRTAENEALRAEVARLQEEKTRLIGVLQENERLRRLVGFKRKRDDLELVPARVVARDVTPYFRVLKVSLQADAELEPRMPVVVAEGVVGQIHRIYGRFADVIVVSDPRSRIDVLSQRTRARGVVEGLGHESDYLARVGYLSEKDEVRVGDVMVTSGMGGIFPRELVVGRIAEIDRAERGLFQEARVEPSVDFARLEEVFVVVSEP